MPVPQRPRSPMATASRAPTRMPAAAPEARAAPAAPPMRRKAPIMRRRPQPPRGGRDRAGSGMSPDEVQVWMESASPEDRRLAEQALRDGGHKAAAETIRNIEDQRLVTQAAGTARRAPPVVRPTARARAAPRQVAGAASGGRQRRPPPAPSRPMVQKGGLYRGKPHAYVAGGSVTDTSKRSRRKK
jgi:hypothetical protein